MGLVGAPTLLLDMEPDMEPVMEVRLGRPREDMSGDCYSKYIMHCYIMYCYTMIVCIHIELFSW